MTLDYIDEKTVFETFGLKHWETRRKFEKLHNLTPIYITPQKRGYRLSDIERILGTVSKPDPVKLSKAWKIER